MNEIKFNVESTNTGYSAFHELETGGIAATTGENLEQLKYNALESYNLLMSELKEAPATLEQIILVPHISNNQ